jgi:hypothetical protein
MKRAPVVLLDFERVLECLLGGLEPTDRPERIAVDGDRITVFRSVADKKLSIGMRVRKIAKAQCRLDCPFQRFALDSRVLMTLDQFVRVECLDVTAVVGEQPCKLQLHFGRRRRKRQGDG